MRVYIINLIVGWIIFGYLFFNNKDLEIDDITSCPFGEKECTIIKSNSHKQSLNYCLKNGSIKNSNHIICSMCSEDEYNNIYNTYFKQNIYGAIKSNELKIQEIEYPSISSCLVGNNRVDSILVSARTSLKNKTERILSTRKHLYDNGIINSLEDILWDYYFLFENEKNINIKILQGMSFIDFHVSYIKDILLNTYVKMPNLDPKVVKYYNNLYTELLTNKYLYFKHSSVKKKSEYVPEPRKFNTDNDVYNDAMKNKWDLFYDKMSEDDIDIIMLNNRHNGLSICYWALYYGNFGVIETLLKNGFIPDGIEYVMYYQLSQKYPNIFELVDTTLSELYLENFCNKKYKTNPYMCDACKNNGINPNSVIVKIKCSEQINGIIGIYDKKFNSVIDPMYDFPILFLPLSNNEFIIELIPLIIYNIHIYLYSKPTYLKIELYIKNKQVLNYIPNLLKNETIYQISYDELKEKV